MTSLENATPFFTLPLELREQIYKRVLASPLQGPELLRTCREIQAEAHKFLFQRPLRFRSQLSLYDWLDRTPRALLPHVTKISLSILDVDLRSLIHSNASIKQPTTAPRLLTWQLYEEEIEKLNQAFSQLPKVTTVIIRALSSRQSFLYREFLSRVLEILISRYPRLQDLRLEGDMRHQSLSFLSNLRHLQSFSFDGFSSTSSTETASILANLEHLSHLSLISQRGMLTPNTLLHSGLTTKRQSFAGHVMRAINRITSFSVTERIPILSPTMFFTSEVLALLHNHKTLNSMSILLSHTPDVAALESLQQFLGRSVIEQLELDWPNLTPDLLEGFNLISEAVKSLWVRAKSEVDAVDILWSLNKRREQGALQRLEKIVLVRSTKDYGARTQDKKYSGAGQAENKKHNESPVTETTNKDIFLTQSRLQARGVHVAWFTEDP